MIAYIETMLQTKNLTKTFGNVTAVDSVDLEFDSGEFVSVVGPNGAGKTTLFNLITGGLPPSAGTVYFKGEDVTEEDPHGMVNRGLARSFQVTNIFPELTVRENIRASIQRTGEWYNFWRNVSSFDETREEVNEMLSLLELNELKELHADELSHADQRILEIGITLGTEPEVLLLDEPTAGMTQTQTAEFMATLEARVFPQVDLIIMVEHDIDVVMEHSDRVVVLHEGAALVKGDPDTVRTDEDVKRVYLGEAA